MTKDTTKSMLAELNNILEMLEIDGINLNQQETHRAGKILKEEMAESGVPLKKTFLQKLLKTAKDLFPLVAPIIKTLLI
jgi:hypothetical protein